MGISGKTLSRIIACTLVSGLAFPYAVPYTSDTDSVCILAVDASASDTFISKPSANTRCILYTDGSKSFKLNGRTYLQGIVMGDGSYNSGAEITYNTEGTDSISFTLGHVDNSDTSEAEFTVFLDDTLEDKFTLSADNPLREYTIDTSGASKLTIKRSGKYSRYALADVKVNGTASAQKYTVPAYETASAFLDSGFNSTRTAAFDGTNTESFFLMNGRQYFQGLVLGDGSYEKGSSVTFNVENLKSLSFSMGHVDNSNSSETEISIFLDDVLEDKFKLVQNQPVTEYTLDVSGASTVRIVKTGSYSKYAFADISADDKAPVKTFAAPDYKNAGTFISGIYDNFRTKSYDGSTAALSFNMQGETFYQGIVLGDGSYENGSAFSVNVENLSTLSFTLGHVDGSSLGETEFSVYIDNELEDKFTMSYAEPLREYTIDVSKAKNIRISRTKNYSQYGLGNIKADELTSKNTYSVPEYKNSAAFAGSAFDTYRTSVFDGISASVSFNMAGRKYCQGVILGDGSYEKGSAFSLNVENVKTLTFDLGHLDNSDLRDSELEIKLDNEPYDKIALSHNMPVKKVTIDVSKNKVIRFSSSSAYSRYALGDIITETLTPKNTHTAPEYSSDAKFAESAYNCIRSKKYTDDNKFTFFTINGVNYTQGLTIGENNYERDAYAAYNVENAGTVSFTLGNIDGIESKDAKLEIYIDNVLADTLPLAKGMVPAEYCYDVSAASTILFHKTDAYGVYGLGSFSLSGEPSVKPTATAAPSVKPSDTPATVPPTTVPSKVPFVPDGPQTPESPVPSAEPTKTPDAPVCCDLNGDGKTTTTDVKHILKRIVGKIKFSEEQEKAADINGDGAVNTSDALHLLRAIAQISE